MKLEVLADPAPVKTYVLAIVFIAFTPWLYSQNADRLADYLRQHPDADTDGNGVLTREEARAHRQNDPSRGDNLNPTAKIPGIKVSLEDSPVEEVSLQSPDGVDLSFAYRSPKGEGPFPVILFFHGGGGYSPLPGLKNSLETGSVQTRFLNKGYLTVQSTRRPYWKSRNTQRPAGFDAAVNDAVLIVEKVKSLARVDGERLNLYGGSGGGILAIVTASRTEVARVVAGEPATVIAIDPKEGKIASPSEYRPIMENPAKYYTPDRQKEVRGWINDIKCPVLLLQGKPVGLYRTNFEILIPEMKKLGKTISHQTYPDVSHGFYWGTVKAGATVELVEKLVEDVDTFLSE